MLNFEDYVRGVHYLAGSQGHATLSALSRRLGVSKNTASLMVKKLVRRGLLRHPHYGDIALTRSGRHLAEKLTYRHRLIELFLSEKLGLPSERVHAEACRLEHGFSEESIQGLSHLLGYPTVCPHGKPLRP